MLDPEVESRPWEEQLDLDDASYRRQLGYLFERSAFYRGKLRAEPVIQLSRSPAVRGM